MAHLAEVTIEAWEDAATYRFPMRSSADPAEVGTSAKGWRGPSRLPPLADWRRCPSPAGAAAGQPQLGPDAWEALIELIEHDFVAGGLDVLFNYRPGQLLAARDTAYNAINLRRPDAASLIPRDSWGVGHFVPLIGLWRRPAGDRWLVILNSFKARAFSGVEPQPADLMRRAVVQRGRPGREACC